MISFSPLANRLRKLAGHPPDDIRERAVERWEITPPETVMIPPALFLPGQIDLIRKTEFAERDETIAVCIGNRSDRLTATHAYRLRDVDLVDGVLHAGGAQRYLRIPQRRRPAYLRPARAVSGTLYESWSGNRWFGMWLMTDCLTYQLAEAIGTPMATDWQLPGNMARFEALLGQAPERIGDVHFDELVLFDDVAPNSGMAARAAEMRRRLLQQITPRDVPGVYLLRGRSGDRRLLLNELEIAERLQAELGFAVLDPLKNSADEILAACAATPVLVSVEGSHLANGVAVMPPGSAILTIQPPDRMTTALKIFTDLRRQHFAFCMAEGGMGEYRADWSLLMRTLDLVDANRK